MNTIPTLNIIHLQERTDRRNILLKQLIAQKIPYKIWHGVEIANQPYRAISRSHKAIVQFAKDTNQPYVIVGEDDLLFTSPRAWQYYLDNMPEDFDIYLGTISGGEVN